MIPGTGVTPPEREATRNGWPARRLSVASICGLRLSYGYGEKADEQYDDSGNAQGNSERQRNIGFVPPAEWAATVVLSSRLRNWPAGRPASRFSTFWWRRRWGDQFAARERIPESREGAIDCGILPPKVENGAIDAGAIENGSGP